MAFTTDDIKHLASLARIKIPEEEKAQLANELSGILNWIDQLNQVQTEGIPEYSDLYAVPIPERTDTITEENQVEDIVAEGPEIAHNMFAVPKVVE